MGAYTTVKFELKPLVFQKRGKGLKKNRRRGICTTQCSFTRVQPYQAPLLMLHYHIMITDMSPVPSFGDKTMWALSVTVVALLAKALGILSLTPDARLHRTSSSI